MGGGRGREGRGGKRRKPPRIEGLEFTDLKELPVHSTMDETLL